MKNQYCQQLYLVIEFGFSSLQKNLNKLIYHHHSYISFINNFIHLIQLYLNNLFYLRVIAPSEIYPCDFKQNKALDQLMYSQPPEFITYYPYKIANLRMSQDQNPVDLNYTPSPYSLALNHYFKFQFKSILPLLASISKSCALSAHFPIFKLMKAVNKIFMLNEVEVIFLAYLIKQSNWDTKDKVIFMNAEHVQDLVFYSIDNIDYKRLILYLMIISFTVKFYLNDKTSSFLEEASKKCPNFKNIFQNWAKKHSYITSKINPRALNIVYKKLYSSLGTSNIDFNLMVDAIIQISPAYNSDKQTPKKEDKKKNVKIQPQIKRQEVIVKREENDFLPSQSHFLLNDASNPFCKKEQNLYCNLFAGGRDIRMMGSSLVGVLKYEVKEQADCSSLMVGLRDCESEEQSEYKRRRKQSQRRIDQYTSVIDLKKRGQPIPEKQRVIVTFPQKEERQEDSQRKQTDI